VERGGGESKELLLFFNQLRRLDPSLFIEKQAEVCK